MGKAIIARLMDILHLKRCKPCEGGVLPLDKAEAATYMKQLAGQWKLEDGKKIKCEFIFKDFKEAMVFVNNIAKVAEEEQHHPDIHIFYHRVVIELWTHAIMGLSENDFIVAAKIEKLA